jgi:glutathione S-transferase
MSDLTLCIGDKNLSSWSLRPWLLMKQSGIPFTEKLIRLDRPQTKEAILKFSPSGLVPCLVDRDIAIWDSLAIAEYLAERFPEKHLWPTAAAARARARSISAEMHSSFAELRKVWPMNFSRIGMRHLRPPGVARDIDRISKMWTEARAAFGAGGPFLFGAFSVADAMYAPVVSRFMTYGPVDLPAAAAAYCEAVFSLPAMQEWGSGAAKEVAQA